MHRRLMRLRFFAIAAQMSDVRFSTPSMRKAIPAQSLLNFPFNAAVIGVTINLFVGTVSVIDASAAHAFPA